MEHVGAMSEGEWNNLSGMYSSSSTKEEADFMAQLLGNCSLPPTELPNCWPDVHESMLYSSSDDNNNNNNNNNNAAAPNVVVYDCFSSQGSGASAFVFPSSSSHQGYYHQYPASESHEFLVSDTSSTPASMSMDYYVFEAKKFHNSNFMEDDFLNRDVSNGSMEEESHDGNNNSHFHHGINLQLGGHGSEHAYDVEIMPSSSAAVMSNPALSDSANKRPRIHSDNNKNKRSVKAKKNQRFNPSPSSSSAGHDEGDEDNVIERHNKSMMSCCSEDESNATTSSTSKLVNHNGKTRASRGSATDPQSLYARKRRERINERLRILQNLVPNGTKVDISTMLEEAVQYVKFLQLQIKLLSSDDLWMYAPIAFNGMDIGLDLKINGAASANS